MSKKRRLLLQDENGNLVEPEVLASEVLMENGQTAEEAIEGAGNVNTITLNGDTVEPDEKGDVKLSIDVPEQAQADWDENNSSSPSYIKHKPTIPAGIVVDPELDAESDNAISNSAVAAAIAQIRTALETLEAAGVSVTTVEDGTFTIHAGRNDYTVNLNHTHPNMAKLVVCEESDLPSTPDNSTIYVITDSGETEIEKLIIRGLEFAGGGVPDTGEPMISSPSNGSTINLGTNEGSGVSKTITIKGKNLTGDLTVAVGTGLTISYGQSTGQSSVTIPMAQASLGAQVTIAYSGSGALDDGSLVIRQGNDVLSSVVVVVVTELPNGYTRLEYVDNAVRGIDTGILATDSQDISQSVAGSSWEVDVQCNSAPASNEMVVVANEDVGHWFGAVASTGCFGSGGADYCFSSPATTRQQIQVAFFSNKIVLTSGGVTKTRDYTYRNNYNVCLLRNVNPNVQQYAGLQFTGRVYSIKCTSGGSFDAVPAQRTSDGAKGLYDKANDVFYPLT